MSSASHQGEKKDTTPHKCSNGLTEFQRWSFDHLIEIKSYLNQMIVSETLWDDLNICVGWCLFFLLGDLQTSYLSFQNEIKLNQSE